MRRWRHKPTKWSEVRLNADKGGGSLANGGPLHHHSRTRVFILWSATKPATTMQRGEQRESERRRARVSNCFCNSCEDQIQPDFVSLKPIAGEKFKQSHWTTAQRPRWGKNCSPYLTSSFSSFFPLFFKAMPVTRLRCSRPCRRACIIIYRLMSNILYQQSRSAKCLNHNKKRLQIVRWVTASVSFCLKQYSVSDRLEIKK